MLNAFGIFEGAVGLILVVWVFNIGFMIKQLVKEQKETNRILRQLNLGSGPSIVSKAS